MVRVIVHPGFHKTGTSSLQAYLSENRETLAPYLTFYGKEDFPRAGTAARIYAQKPYPWRLRQFRRALDSFLADIPDAPVIVLSRETFSGAMPGHRRHSGRLITGYDCTAQRLGRQITAALRARFGPQVEITWFFTVRDLEPWIRSVYGHLLRSIHLTEDFDTFRAQFPDLPDLSDLARKIARDIGVPAPHLARLEDTGARREGPAAALLDLLEVPATVRAGLPAAQRHNPGQDPALEEAFLALNRSGADKETLRQHKDAMLRDRSA